MFITRVIDDLLNFNSIKVRLNLNRLCFEYDSNVFQFHKGTIKPYLVIRLLLIFLHFNSIKVRLNLSVTL